MIIPMLFLLLSSDVPNTAVTINSLDFQNEEIYPDREYFFSMISQIETDRDRIFLSSKYDHRIVVINRSGDILHVFGSKGKGPGEFERGIAAFSVRGKKLWVIDGNYRDASFFIDDKFQRDIPLRSSNVAWFTNGTNSFDFTDSEVLIPAAPQDGLAIAYGEKGPLKTIGPAQYPQQYLMGVNDTMWLRHEDKWYCVFKFYPVIHVYNQSFELEHLIELKGRDFAAYQERASEGDTQFTHFPRLFTDFKVFNNKLYLMQVGLPNGPRGCLLEVDPTKKAITHRVVFMGKGPDFVDTDGGGLSMDYFAFLEDGTLVLGKSIALWNHDLWLTKLPFIGS